MTSSNYIAGHYGTIGGGLGNQVLENGGFIGGGSNNKIQTGSFNVAVAGGNKNSVEGSNANEAFIGAGLANTNRGRYAVIGGGNINSIGNQANYSFIGSGKNNRIQPGFLYGAILAGEDNEVAGNYSMAGGRRAKAAHHGTFVWSDDTAADFASTGTDQFLIRASGGVAIGAENPNGHLHVRGSGTTRPHLFLQDTDSGLDNYVSQRFKQGGNLYWELAVGGGTTNVFQVNNFRNGTVLTLNEDGEMFVKVLTILGGADLAEPFPMDEENIPKGSLVIIDETDPGRLRLSESAYDSRVAGIVSGANGVQPGLTLRQEGVMEGNQQVALSGRVYARADAAYGPIKPGDLLTTSDTPGHAMAASDASRTPGAVVGKAMSGLKEGQGLVLVLVTLQ
jgi:hypothetical protein